MLTLSLVCLASQPALAMPILDFDLSDPDATPLTSASGDYSVILDQPTAEPTFTFSTGDVIHMAGRVTFNELLGKEIGLLVFTSFREAPSVGCGAGTPSARLAASPGADVNLGASTHQGSAIVSNPDGTICSSELSDQPSDQPFLTMVFDEATEGEQREFAFDLVLDGPMDGSAGLRALYKGYAVVPEPSTVLLVALGIPMLARLGRRHSAASDRSP